MVAINQRYHKAAAGIAGGGGTNTMTPRNRIATYADDAAVNMDQTYASIASEVNAARQAPISVNRVPENVSAVVDEAAIIQQRRAQAEQAVSSAAREVEAEAAQTQLTDKIYGYTDGALQVAGFAPIIVGGAQMLTNGVKSAGSAVGSMLNLTSAEKAASAVPARSWNEITFSEIGEATGTKNLVGGIVQGGADIVATPTHWLAERTGLSGWRNAVNTRKAASHFADAKSVMHELTAADRSALGMLHTHVSGASNVGHLAGKDLKGLITAAQEAGAEGKLSAAGSKFLNSVEDSMLHHESAATWSNVKGAIKESPKNMGKSSATHGLMNTAFIGMSALSMFGDARSFSQNLESLRQMYADITGEDVKQVSTMKLLTGSVPEPVAEARSHMIKNFGAKQVFDVANIAINVAQLVNPKWGSSWKAFGAMVGTQLASTAVDGIMGESILPVHKAFSDAYKTGKHIPPEFYAAYIYAASKDLSSRGEKGQEFAMKVAEQYAAERASPGQVLKEISSGKLLERIQSISSQYDQNQAGPAQAGMAQQGQAVARLNGADKAERPVVGKFTQRLNQEAQMAGVGQAIL